uniref:Uncharacterized protein n=1 Tax=Lates calcarifer TaxID=8187 RepID=A0A4W6CXK5_LATCA
MNVAVHNVTKMKADDSYSKKLTPNIDPTILSINHISFDFSTMANSSCFPLYGLRGLALSSRSELQQVLERRKRVQSDQEEEGQSRTPLEDVLLRRQQKQLEVIDPVNRLENFQQWQKMVREEAQLMEFVRVRQNLRKIHSVIQNKAANF